MTDGGCSMPAGCDMERDLPLPNHRRVGVLFASKIMAVGRSPAWIERSSGKHSDRPLGDHPFFEYSGDRSRRLYRGRLGSWVRRGGHRFRRRIGAYRHCLFPHRHVSHIAILAGFRIHPSAWRDIRRFLNKAASSRRTQFRAHHLIPGDRDLHLRVHPVYIPKGG
jgi:hypothetical protein